MNRAGWGREGEEVRENGRHGRRRTGGDGKERTA